MNPRCPLGLYMSGPFSGAWLLAFLLWPFSALSQPAAVPLCFNYACHDQALIFYSAAQMAEALAHLQAAHTAEQEREHLAHVLGRLYAWAAQQSPIGADQPGNRADQEVDGRMDCIDHTTNNEHLIALLEARGGVRFHRLAERKRRTQFLYQHYSAVIEEKPAIPPSKRTWDDHDSMNPLGVMLALCDCPEVLNEAVLAAPSLPVQTPPAFAIDSWFVRPGEPALVFPLSEWLKGAGPDVR
jgi:hypothetical protein